MNSILVLLYHGVTDQSAGKFNNLRNYNKKHLNKNTFEKQIESINKSCEVISIDQLVHYWNTNYEIKKPTVVITFDDGFRNNYSIAKPILEKYEVPATFYISTGNVSEQKLFWVDLLEIIFSKTRIKEINSKTFPTIYSFIPNQKNNINLDNRLSKIEALNLIKKKLKLCHPKFRAEKIKNIALELKVDNSYKIDNCPSEYSILSWDELRNINSNDLFTIGGHSRWHNILSKLNGHDLEDEIKGSIEDIKNNLGMFSGHYAYPEGQKEHFNSETIKVLKKLGVRACPSAIQGLAEIPSQNLFNFKRVMVGINPSSNKLIRDYIS